MQEHPISHATGESAQPAFDVHVLKPQKNWWQRLMNPDPPDPRKAAREAVPGLSSYFWTGGVPVAHPIRDISLTGLYVVTEERWYPGTEITMTLTKPDWGGAAEDQSISLRARAVRWGNDGVGLWFMLAEKSRSRTATHLADDVDRAELELFLHRLRTGTN